jgi:hypothetical protein
VQPPAAAAGELPEQQPELDLLLVQVGRAQSPLLTIAPTSDAAGTIDRRCFERWC